MWRFPLQKRRTVAVLLLKGHSSILNLRQRSPSAPVVSHIPKLSFALARELVFGRVHGACHLSKLACEADDDDT